MPVLSIQKDLLTVKRGMIVHQVNAQGVAGAGLARVLFDKYPVAGAWYKAKRPSVGRVQIIPVNKDLWVCNLVGQSFYGRDKQYTEYWAIREGLETIQKFCIRRGLKPIYFPHGMGCGLGGGAWSIGRSSYQKLFRTLLFVSILKEGNDEGTTGPQKANH